MKLKVKSFLITVFLIAIYCINVHASDSILRWDASTGDVSGYTIYYGLSIGNYTFSKDVGNVTQYALDNFSLSEGTTYYFVVRAYNESGESEDSNVSSYAMPSAGDTTPPLPPEGVSGEIVNEDILLTWQANSEIDISGYRVYYGTTNRDYGLPIPVEGTEYLIVGLSPDVTYYFAVTAVDASGNESGYSSPEIQKTIMPVADTQAPSVLIESPTAASSYDTTASSIDISGTASDDTGVTEVIWSNSRGGSGTASSTDSWSVSDIVLGEGDNVITITARDEAGNESTDVLTVVYTILDTTPPVVTDTQSPVLSMRKPTKGEYYFARKTVLTLSGTASDNIGVKEVRWVHDQGGSGVAIGTSIWKILDVPLVKDWNNITIIAEDEEGNTTSYNLTVFLWEKAK